MSVSLVHRIRKSFALICLASGILPAAMPAQAAMYGGVWILNHDKTHTIIQPTYADPGGFYVGISAQTPGENVCRLFGLTGYLGRELGPYDARRMICTVNDEGKLKSYFDGETSAYSSVTCAQFLE